VRSREEIMRTLNVHDRNRGLSFDPEMVPYCGQKRCGCCGGSSRICQ